MQRKYSHLIHIPGTLSANISVVFTAPSGCQLVHVSAVGSNANDGKLTIGTTADTDAYLVSSAIGDSDVPEEFERTDFVSDQFPDIADGTVVSVALDYDGDGGTATADFTCVMTFVEG